MTLPKIDPRHLTAESLDRAMLHLFARRLAGDPRSRDAVPVLAGGLMDSLAGLASRRGDDLDRRVARRTARLFLGMLGDRGQVPPT
jgi:hypothetical protein